MAAKTDLTELGDYLNPVLGIPIGGKTYRVQAISAQNAIIIEKSMNDAAAQIKDGAKPDEIELASDEAEEDYIVRVLGDTYQELLDGGAPIIAIKHVMAIVLAWNFGSFEKAVEYHEAGGKVRPAVKAPADHKPKTATQTSTGADTTTRKQASRTGTSTQKATAKADPGKTSSTTGTP